MTPEQQRAALVIANQEALNARAAGHHPFAAVLVAPDGETILDRQGNIDTVNHAVPLANIAVSICGTVL
jgi:tRNA(Arg) A34 adenosine deaminase TadA